MSFNEKVEDSVTCRYCDSHEHISQEHSEVGSSGIQILNVSKLIPEIKIEYPFLPNKVSRYFRSGLTDVYYAKHLVNDILDHQRNEGGPLAALKGQIVVDLGAGMGHAYFVAAANDAKGYIAVEPSTPGRIKKFLLGETNNQDQPSDNVFAKERIKIEQDFKKNHRDFKRIPIAIVGEDMLSFLRELPDKSVSIIASGIDGAIIDNDHAREVDEEIARVLHPDGLVISNSSIIGLAEYSHGLQEEKSPFIFVSLARRKTEEQANQE